MGENIEATEIATPDFPSKPKNKLGNCLCSEFEVGFTIDRGDDEPEVTIEKTACGGKQTKRTFAQGHDAKLKSLLIKAGVQGMEVRWGRATGVLRIADPLATARKFGFGQQVEEGIRNQLDKLAKRRQPIPPAPREVAAEVVEGTEEGDVRIVDLTTEEGIDQLIADATGGQNDDATVPSRAVAHVAKVGRWEYEGIELEDGGFQYRSASGEVKIAPAGRWTKVG